MPASVPSKSSMVSNVMMPWRYVAVRMYVTRHTSHVTRHTSHVKSYTSNITRYTSQVTCPTSHVTKHMSHVRSQTSPSGQKGKQQKSTLCKNVYEKVATRLTTNVIHHTSHTTRNTSHVARHTSQVTRYTSNFTCIWAQRHKEEH